MPKSLPREEREFEHARLRHDVEVIRAYGEAHPDQWSDLFFDNEPTVRIVTLFSCPNIEIHESVLRELVENPNQLLVRRTEYSRRQLEEILARVRGHSSDPGAFHSTGITKGRVRVWLAADQESLATALLEEYGYAVEIKVGNFSFPTPEELRPSTEESPRKVSDEIPMISIEGLDVVVTDVVVVSGRSGTGSLEFTNHGSKEVVLDTNGVVTARVADPSTGEIVGGYVGAHAMPLIRFSIHPGETVSVPLLVGTASFRPDFGYAVPPGRWEIYATVKVHGVGDRRLPGLPVTVVAVAT